MSQNARYWTLHWFRVALWPLARAYLVPCRPRCHATTIGRLPWRPLSFRLVLSISVLPRGFGIGGVPPAQRRRQFRIIQGDLFD